VPADTFVAESLDHYNVLRYFHAMSYEQIVIRQSGCISAARETMGVAQKRGQDEDQVDRGM
jgi:hypothetical protein